MNLSEQLSQASLESSQPSHSSTASDPTYVYKPEKQASVIETVQMPFKRVITTEKYCCLCSSASGRLQVPFEACMQAFIKKRIFISNRNRCCSKHLIKKRFYDEELDNLRIVSNYSRVEVTELSKYLEQLSVRCDSTIHDKIGDFSLSEEQIKALTGFTWENIIQLRDMMTSIRNTANRSVTQALVVFLFKFRTGNSNKLIASILQLEHKSQVSEFCESVIKSFEKDILPSHFGIQTCSRENLNNQSSVYLNKLYGVENQLAIICDGSYIRHQKSSNNEYQRKSYSGQKKVPLCKPFTICTTNGFVIDVLGPFYATQNDAQILQISLSDLNGLRSILKKGDIFILDRGFRDVKKFLENEGYQVLMPALKGNRPQLTTQESNESRLITKLRWVIEAVHGIIAQKFKLLHHQLDNKLLHNAASYCKIACFLINTFGKRLNSDVGIYEEVMEQMLLKRNVNNSLAIEAETKRWSRRKLPFQKLSSTELMDFPEMTENDLKVLFTGSYQLSQAVSYLAEIMDDNGNINANFLKANKSIVKFEVRSRHINRKTYKCYIEYAPNTIGKAGILRYTCECANGLRTIGCCSHVAAITYYLTHARYLSRIVRPAEALIKLFNVEKINPVINDNSDED